MTLRCSSNITELSGSAIADEFTILQSRRLLENHGLAPKLQSAVTVHLRTKGRIGGDAWRLQAAPADHVLPWQSLPSESGVATMNISLPDELKQFVDTQVAEQGYTSSSEYPRELIRKQGRPRRCVAH